MIDSALTIQPRPLKPLPGQAPTDFSTIVATDPVSAQTYAIRDRKLAWRDLQVAFALAKTALRASTVTGAPGPRPRFPMVVSDDLLSTSADRPDSANRLPTDTSNPSRVAHVLYASVPIDAALTDRTLYERDIMLAEAAAVLADKYGSGDQPSPTDHVDSGISESLVGLVNWSLAEGKAEAAGVSPNLPLVCSTFKNPDAALADRDNVLAAVAARLAAWASNPFESATRLLIEVRAADNTLQLEAEPYLLSSSTNDLREWTAAAGRPKVVYDRNKRTLQWFGADNDARIPQRVDSDQALSGAGARLKLQVPSGQTLSVWRQQAARLVTSDMQVSNETVFTASGGQQQEFQSIVVPGSSGAVTFSNSSAVSGAMSAALMLWPRGPVRLPGQVYSSGSNVSVVGRGLKYTSASGASAVWNVTLPAGLSFTVSLKVSIVDGSASFSITGSGASTFGVSTSSSGVIATGAAAVSGSLTISVTATGSGRLVIDEVVFGLASPPSGIVDLQVSAQLGGQPCPASVSTEYGQPVVAEFSVASGSGATLAVSMPAVPVGCVVQSPAILTRSQRYSPAFATAARGFKTSLLKKIEARLADAYRAAVDGLGVRRPATSGTPEESLPAWTASQSVSVGTVVAVDSSSFPVWSGADYVVGTEGSGSGLGYTTNTATPAFVVVKYTPPGGSTGHFRGRRSVDLGNGQVGIPASKAPTDVEYWGRVANPPVFAYQCVVSGTTNSSIPSGLKAGNREVSETSGLTWRRRQPTYSVSGVWTVESTRAWMAALTVAGQLAGSGGVVRLATAADVGKPALVPRGLKWTVSGADGHASLEAGPEDAVPEFTLLQPWMLTIEAFVAHEDFWV